MQTLQVSWNFTPCRYCPMTLSNLLVTFMCWLISLQKKVPLDQALSCSKTHSVNTTNTNAHPADMVQSDFIILLSSKHISCGSFLLSPSQFLSSAFQEAISALQLYPRIVFPYYSKPVNSELFKWLTVIYTFNIIMWSV